MTAVTSTHAPDPMPRRLTMEQWDVAWAGREDAYELVDGIPTVAPPEIARNNRAAGFLMTMLDRLCGPDAFATLQHEVVVDEIAPTVRRPDVAVLNAASGDGCYRSTPGHALLVVEIVSPSSVVRDWRDKRGEYAAAGIPAYLVIDLADGEQRVTLFSQPVGGEYTSVAGGASVTLDLPGGTLTLTPADLVPRQL